MQFGRHGLLLLAAAVGTGRCLALSGAACRCLAPPGAAAPDWAGIHSGSRDAARREFAGGHTVKSGVAICRGGCARLPRTAA